MRNHILLAFALLSAFVASAQSPAKPSRHVYTDVRDITVTSDSVRGLNIKLSAADNIIGVAPDKSIGVDIPFDRKISPARFAVSIFGDIYFGMTYPSGSDSRLSHSWEWGIREVFAVRWKTVRWTDVSFGFGLAYCRLNADKGYHLSKDLGIVTAVPNSEQFDNVKSKLDSWRITFPLTWHIYPSGDFEIKLGVIGNIDLYTTATTSYSDDTYRYKVSYRHLPVHTFSADFYGGVGFNEAIGIYVKYSPTPLFRSACGPDFDILSFGLSFNF